MGSERKGQRIVGGASKGRAVTVPPPAPLAVNAEQIAVLLGLSLFFGLAFEEFYANTLPNRPGGVRTFPLLALTGAGLFAVEPHTALPFVAGLLVLGMWLYGYVRANLQVTERGVEGHFVVPTSNVLAYTLGAITITQPLWLSVGLTVAAVLLLASRRPLHDLAERIAREEILTAGRFLIVVGVILPILVNQPPLPFTSITPFQVWLAVVAVSTLSYVSYLAQRYLFPQRGVLLTAVLGGLYSSTATTVVLAQRAREQRMTPLIVAGMVAATGMMYARILIVTALFNTSLARALLVPFATLAVVAIAVAVVVGRTATSGDGDRIEPSNPLQLQTAFIFAGLLIVISVLTRVVEQHVGARGVLALGAIVGVTDIDPFVLSIAQGGAAATGITIAAAAIAIASSSNNVLKAIYAVAFSRQRASLLPAFVLLATAALGLVAAWMLLR